MPIFCFSTDEENFHDYCEAENIDAARKIAEEELELKPGDTYYVGLREDVQPTSWQVVDPFEFTVGE